MKQLLVLDDRSEDLEVFRQVVPQLDCKAYITDDFQDAMEFCKHNRVDILVSDLNVGEDISGFDLMQAVQQLPDSGTIRRIIYSTESPSPNYDKMEKFNVVGWIVKPADEKSLLLTLKNILAGKYHSDYVNLK
ncbi:response regulator receiver domain-containing protein [Alteromonadaceae bacterium 2753L.S.0a.02]|nr:response regulator receiver domain-containing protein [Alteromonadaceae bacterium 2753L.S.0a.02]